MHYLPHNNESLQSYECRVDKSLLVQHTTVLGIDSNIVPSTAIAAACAWCDGGGGSGEESLILVVASMAAEADEAVDAIPPPPPPPRWAMTEEGEPAKETITADGGWPPPPPPPPEDEDGEAAEMPLGGGEMEEQDPPAPTGEEDEVRSEKRRRWQRSKNSRRTASRQAGTQPSFLVRACYYKIAPVGIAKCRRFIYAAAAAETAILERRCAVNDAYAVIHTTQRTYVPDGIKMVTGLAMGAGGAGGYMVLVK
jgi:type IV secretory pathway VirB10-like protein